MSKGGKQGTSMGGLEYSPHRQRRIRKAMARQEKRWAAKAGPVVVKNVADLTPEQRAKYGL